MKRILATIALATATATSFAAPSFAAILSDGEIARIEAATGVDASNLTLSQQAEIHALTASDSLSSADVVRQIRSVVQG